MIGCPIFHINSIFKALVFWKFCLSSTSLLVSGDFTPPVLLLFVSSFGSGSGSGFNFNFVSDFNDVSSSGFTFSVKLMLLELEKKKSPFYWLYLLSLKSLTLGLSAWKQQWSPPKRCNIIITTINQLFIFISSTFKFRAIIWI